MDLQNGHLNCSLHKMWCHTLVSCLSILFLGVIVIVSFLGGVTFESLTKIPYISLLSPFLGFVFKVKLWKMMEELVALEFKLQCLLLGHKKDISYFLFWLSMVMVYRLIYGFSMISYVSLIIEPISINTTNN